MSIFLDLATDALTEIGQLGTGQTIAPEQATQAQRVANRMLLNWGTQRLWLFNTPRVPLTLSPFVQDYTIGPSGATFTRARPTFIQAGEVAGPGSEAYQPLNILDATRWSAIRDKGATCSASGVPQDFWPEYTFPNLTLHFWTKPSSAAVAVLQLWEQLQQFATLFDNVSMPPGYEHAIVHMLAIELCPYYDMPVPQSVGSLAQQSMAAIWKVNAQGLGGALGESQMLNMPNVGQPQPSAGAAQ